MKNDPDKTPSASQPRITSNANFVALHRQRLERARIWKTENREQLERGAANARKLAEGIRQSGWPA